MREIGSKSALAVVLSKLGGFDKPKVRQEQYLMDSETGASLLWNACLLGDLKGKVVADLGCGTGILGIGALLLGANESIFIDSDENALKIAKNNIAKVKSESYRLGKVKFLHEDIRVSKAKADVVIQNPPFGTKIIHNDVLFLTKAFDMAPIVYSFHKSETKPFLERFSTQKDAIVTHAWDFKFPIKATFSFHRRQIRRVNVSCLRFVHNK